MKSSFPYDFAFNLGTIIFTRSYILYKYKYLILNANMLTAAVCAVNCIVHSVHEGNPQNGAGSVVSLSQQE